jgi:putative peptide zinc metalloprotease protein
MAVVPGTTTGRDDTADAGSSRPVSAPGDVPVRADGVELIGEMKGSGYREPPALARRGDGQTIQLTPLLYLVLANVDGRRTYAEVAERVSAAYGRTVTADNVRSLVDDQLRAHGLLARDDGSQPEVRRSNPLLGLRFKYAVTDPERTRRITAPFARLFNPLVVLLVLAAFAGVCWWVFMEKGLASATYEAFDNPALLLLVFAVTVLSAGFHEFGHAAAARRGGSTPGVMGAGVYLVWPAFYTDVTDSYRLGRGGRVRTDLGGLYFNAIVAVAIAGVWWGTRWDALLLVVATQILQMVRQLTPLVRFDGYHVLADLTGVPDLFHRIKPTLLGVLPWRWRHPETRVLKPWARAVVTVWVLAVVPMLAFSLFCMVVTLPRILGTAEASARKQSAFLARAWHAGDFLEVAARSIAIVAVVFPILATGVILFRLGRRVGTGVWRRTSGRPLRRALAGLVALGVAAALVFVWWPRPGSYRPIQPYEGGTLRQVAAAVPGASPTGLRAGQYGRFVTGWADDDPRPTQEHPQLALVLLPHDDGATGSTSTDGSTAPGTGGSGTGPAGWVFPFDKPLAPGPGDNQALAVNTTDGTIRYDVAFALVWVEDDSPALNTNEAYAFASCTSCGAVAIGFQVVLVTGDNHVAVPQNLAGALNYNCVNCLTYALASQLFLTLDGPLSDEGMRELDAVWQRIAEFGQNITQVPLNEIQSTLEGFQQEIRDVVAKDQGTTTTDPEGTGTATDGATDGPSAGATDAGTPTGAASPGADGSGTTSDGTSSGTSGGTGTSGTTGSQDGTSQGGSTSTDGQSGTTDGTTGGSTPSGEQSPAAGQSSAAPSP